MLKVEEKITAEKVLSLIPQKEPFRFIEKILEISENRIIGQYRYKSEDFFYQGHFPGNPVTPGVILLETMAQTGVVALGIYLTLISGSYDDELITFFTDAEVDFLFPVFPGELVTVIGKKVFFRHNKLKSEIELKKEDGTIAASGTLSGMGVKKK